MESNDRGAIASLSSDTSDDLDATPSAKKKYTLQERSAKPKRKRRNLPEEKELELERIKKEKYKGAKDRKGKPWHSKTE